MTNLFLEELLLPGRGTQAITPLSAAADAGQKEPRHENTSSPDLRLGAEELMIPKARENR